MDIHLNKKKHAKESGKATHPIATVVVPKTRATYALRSSSSKRSNLSNLGTSKSAMPVVSQVSYEAVTRPKREDK